MIQQKFSKKAVRSHLKQTLMARRGLKKSVRRGQALVEMAMVTVILLILTLGLIQYGLIANAKVTMTNLAREGARFAAVHAFDTNNTTAPLDDGIKDYVVNKVAKFTTLKDLTKAGVAVTYPAGRTGGQEVNVTVTYNMSNKFILPSGFASLINVSPVANTTAVMVVEGAG